MEDLQPETFPEVQMLIDTGAAFTLVESPVIVLLGFRPIRYREVIGIGQAATMRPVFRMSVGLTMGDGLGNTHITVVREDVVGMVPPETDEPYVGVLGRDFLRHFELIYNGPKARYELRRNRPTTTRGGPPGDHGSRAKLASL